MLLRIILAAILVLPAQAVLASTVSGRPVVVDGDSLELRGERIRLNGIDAVEGPQECLDARGRPWACGRAAAAALQAFLDEALPTVCEEIDRDQYDRMIAVCWRADGVEVNAWLVAKGWALDYTRHSGGAYAKLEAAAAAEGLGIWAGSFAAPSQWRQGHRR
ncbi:MAG: thermonuclease family protein [Bauldia sp.]|nr:thermonuclease family protein [Bauldia sp.]